MDAPRTGCATSLSWLISHGRADDLDVSGFEVVLAGGFDADELGSPWRVALYVDERADAVRRAALADIFLGRAGGTTLAYFASAIGEVYAVRAVRIRLDHTPGRQRIQVDDHVVVRAVEPVEVDAVVSCGIPGHDRPGTEMLTDVQRVEDPPLLWEVFGRCGFATDFAYDSDGG